MKLPLSLAYPRASTVIDADGIIVCECIDPAAAGYIVAIVAAAVETVRAEAGSAFAWRTAYEAQGAVVRGADQGEGPHG